MTVVAHNDREAVKVLKKMPDGPPMSVRLALAEPCIHLMGLEPEHAKLREEARGR